MHANDRKLRRTRRGFLVNMCLPAIMLGKCPNESLAMFPIRKPAGPVLPPEPIIPVGQRKTMETLMANDCRWPIGDPQGADFHFCGKQKVGGYPYCDFHVRRASQPSKPRTVAYPHFAG